DYRKLVIVADQQPDGQAPPP
ncbi:hypothetical protein Tco_1158417, partial [Tanacetum coccineum]